MKKMMIILTIMVMVMVAGCGKKEDNVDYITASVVFDDGSICDVNKTHVNASEIIMAFAYDIYCELAGEQYWIDKCEVSEEELLAFCGQ